MMLLHVLSMPMTARDSLILIAVAWALGFWLGTRPASRRK